MNLCNKALLTCTILALNRVAIEIDIFTSFESEFMMTTLFLLSSELNLCNIIRCIIH